jgi:creatinine amidohydrolase
MTPTPYLLSRATFRDLKNAHYDLAVLPWGATEPHNYHLPYGTDIVETEQIAAEAARRASAKGARIIVLPCVPFGVNVGQLGIPLTINMNPSTQQAVLHDVATSLERQGIQKLLVLNGHGGNDFRQMIRELQLSHSIFICMANWFRSVNLKAHFEKPGDHADEMETSLMLHLAPDQVLPMSEAGEGKERKLRITAFREGWAWTPRDWIKVTADTGTGDPRAATAEKGSAYFEAVVTKMSEFLVDLASIDLNEMYES